MAGDESEGKRKESSLQFLLPHQAPTCGFATRVTLEKSSTHQTPQAKNIPHQSFLIKPVFSLLANAEKTGFFPKLVFQCLPLYLSYARICVSCGGGWVTTRPANDFKMTRVTHVYWPSNVL